MQACKEESQQASATFSGTTKARPVASVTVAARATRGAKRAAALARNILRLMRIFIHARHVAGQARSFSRVDQSTAAMTLVALMIA